MQIFFMSRIGPDILMIALVIGLYSLTGQPEFCLILTLEILSQIFLVWSFTENASFISFYGGIWSRYSEINKFKTSKDLSFQK